MGCTKRVGLFHSDRSKLQKAGAATHNRRRASKASLPPLTKDTKKQVRGRQSLKLHPRSPHSSLSWPSTPQPPPAADFSALCCALIPWRPVQLSLLHPSRSLHLDPRCLQGSLPLPWPCPNITPPSSLPPSLASGATEMGSPLGCSGNLLPYVEGWVRRQPPPFVLPPFASPNMRAQSS